MAKRVYTDSCVSMVKPSLTCEHGRTPGVSNPLLFSYKKCLTETSYTFLELESAQPMSSAKTTRCYAEFVFNPLEQATEMRTCSAKGPPLVIETSAELDRMSSKWVLEALTDHPATITQEECGRRTQEASDGRILLTHRQLLREITEITSIADVAHDKGRTNNINDVGIISEEDYADALDSPELEVFEDALESQNVEIFKGAREMNIICTCSTSPVDSYYIMGHIAGVSARLLLDSGCTRSVIPTQIDNQLEEEVKNTMEPQQHNVILAGQ